MQKQGPIVAWVVDDTGLVKKGTHSVGVTRQYCGQVGKQENCRVAVSLSLSTRAARRRKSTGIPPEIGFQTKPEIALQQIQAAVDRELPTAPVLADAAYGNDTAFRDDITELGLNYVVGVQSSVSVWPPGQAPLPKRKWKGIGRPTTLLRRDSRHAPIAVRELAMSLPSSAWKTVRWREGTGKALRSRFAALRIRPAHRDDWRREPRAEEWLLIEWPSQEAEPTKYWLSTLPE